MLQDDKKYKPDYNPPGYDPKKDVVDLVSYNPEWPNLAETEIVKILEILPNEPIIDIQHVGSTAIPGMLAKPIIDIQIAVDSLEKIKESAISILENAGYVYWYGNPDKERMFFVKGMPPFGERRTHHVHIVEHDSKHWRNKLLFRDYLRTHPAIAQEYIKLKIKLAQEHAYDRERYTDEKTDFINHVLELACAEDLW